MTSGDIPDLLDVARRRARNIQYEVAARALSDALSDGRVSMDEFHTRSQSASRHDEERTAASLPAHTAITAFGRTELDLRGADLSTREGLINCVAFYGGIDIAIPQDCRSVSEGIGFFGAFALTEDASVAVRQDQLLSDSPAIRVRGVPGLGGVSTWSPSAGIP